MKKIMAVVIVGVFLLVIVGWRCGLSWCDRNILVQDGEKVEEMWGEIAFTTTVKCPYDVEQSFLRMNVSEMKWVQALEPIADAEQALIIAKGILEEYRLNGVTVPHELVRITYSTEDDIWCFEYKIPNIEGGAFFVAIKGTEGELIGAFGIEFEDGFPE